METVGAHPAEASQVRRLTELLEASAELRKPRRGPTGLTSRAQSRLLGRVKDGPGLLDPACIIEVQHVDDLPAPALLLRLE